MSLASRGNELSGSAPPLLTDAERQEAERRAERLRRLEWGMFAGPNGELVVPRACSLALRWLIVAVLLACVFATWYALGRHVLTWIASWCNVLPLLVVLFGARVPAPRWLVALWQRTRLGAVVAAVLCAVALSAFLFALIMLIYEFCLLVRLDQVADLILPLQLAKVSAISLPVLIVLKVAMGIYGDWRDEARSRAIRDARSSMCSKMPLETISAADVERDLDGDLLSYGSGRRSCPVCLEDFATGDVRKTLPCFHAFHPTCVDPWLEDHDACPVCRHDIWTNEVDAHAAL